MTAVFFVSQVPASSRSVPICIPCRIGGKPCIAMLWVRGQIVNGLNADEAKGVKPRAGEVLLNAVKLDGIKETEIENEFNPGFEGNGHSNS